MKAIVYEEFEGPIALQQVADPIPNAQGVVIEVKATGLCRSDWHGWMGHDPSIVLPHIPGHELSGIVVEKGAKVTEFNIGDNVTLPFVCGCGSCPQCHNNNHQICDNQFQPGFTAWGSFATHVAIDYADINLVNLPDSISHVTAASLGCRFATSFRAVVDQGAVKAGQWIAVYGCGGVGLSAIMIAKAIGAHVIGIDINNDALQMAKAIGADNCINANEEQEVVEVIKSISGGGVHVSIDALGNALLLSHSVSCLRKRGKHIQVGIMPPSQNMAAIPIDKIIAGELEIYGSHGMQAFRYKTMLDMIIAGQLEPAKLVNKTIALEEVPNALATMNQFNGPGITVIDKF